MAKMPPQKPRQFPPWVHTCLHWTGRLGHPIVLSTIVTGAIVLSMRAIGSLQGLELGLYDHMMRLRPTPPPDDRILVIGIDEADIQARREWPIHDETLRELLQTILPHNPRAVGLDIFRDVPIGAGQDALLRQIQSDARIVTVCKISSPDEPGLPPPVGTPAAQVSFSDLVVDPGGILRRSLLVAEPPGKPDAAPLHVCSDSNAQLMSLSFQMTLRYLAEEGIAVELTPDQEIKFQDTVLPRIAQNFGGYRRVDDSGYQILLNYRAPREAIPQVNLSDVLAGRVSPDQIQNRMIFIGATTPEAKDSFYTPYSGALDDRQRMPGVIVHAQATSQLLSAVLDNRPLLRSWSSAGATLWIVSWGFGGALFAWYIRRPIRFTTGMGVLLGSLYGGSYVWLLQGIWIPLIPPACALVMAAGSVVLIDRFNKSDYGKAVYKQMKSLLRLDIDIDRSKVGQQVAEITETEYFANLQQQGRQLRQRKQLSSSPHQQIPQKPNRPSPSSDTTDNPESYLDNLKRKARRLKPSDFNQTNYDSNDYDSKH